MMFWIKEISQKYIPSIFKGDKHCYNIPEVTLAPHVENRLSEDEVKLPNNCRDDKKLPDFAK